MERSRWLGYRWRGHGLDGSGELGDLLLLGVQDSRGGGAEQALAQRGSTADIGPGGPLTAMWSVRGAPHVHCAERLATAGVAFTPSDEPDPAVEAVAAALTAVVTGPTPKGEASTAVTARLPDLATWCPGCRADHVPDDTFRAAGRLAGLAVTADRAGASVLHPRPEIDQVTDEHPRAAVLDAFWRVNGPTTRAEVRDWSGWETPVVAGLWRDRELVRIDVDGRRLDLPESLADALADAPAAEGAVLVPPHDGYLRHTDRTVLVPDRERRRAVWRAVQPPGALLVDGEVAGTWRLRRTEKTLTITAFDAVPKARRAAAEASAARIADVSVRWD